MSSNQHQERVAGNSTPAGGGAPPPRLSICIATYGRGKFIGETLDSILAQWQPGVEVVVVDGASPDETPAVMAQYVSRQPDIAYYRERENSGVDRDYDKAVGYARGEFCWLMTDDDLLRPGALTRVETGSRAAPAVGSGRPGRVVSARKAEQLTGILRRDIASARSVS